MTKEILIEETPLILGLSLGVTNYCAASTTIPRHVLSERCLKLTCTVLYISICMTLMKDIRNRRNSKPSFLVEREKERKIPRKFKGKGKTENEKE